MLSVIADDAGRSELVMSLDELAREGARRMLAAALEAEVDAYLAAYAAVVDERGHRLVRRNGHAPARQLATGAGQVEVTRPRVDDRRVDPATGQRRQFQSVILPRWVRRSPKVADVLPGDRGRACRWAQGAGRGGRRDQGVDRGLGRAAAGPAASWDGRAGGDGRRRGAGAVAGVAGGVPRHPRAEMLGPQGPECS